MTLRERWTNTHQRYSWAARYHNDCYKFSSEYLYFAQPIHVYGMKAFDNVVNCMILLDSIIVTNTADQTPPFHPMQSVPNFNLYNQYHRSNISSSPLLILRTTDEPSPLQNTIVMHNTCEDSLLATPLILDLVILCELCERISVSNPLSSIAHEHTNLFLSEGILSYFHLKSIMAHATKMPLKCHYDVP